MNVSWLLEAEMFPDYHEALVAEIKDQGHAAKLVPELTWGYRWDDISAPVDQRASGTQCAQRRTPTTGRAQVDRQKDSPRTPGIRSLPQQPSRLQLTAQVGVSHRHLRECRID